MPYIKGEIIGRGDIEISLTITMKATEWLELKKELPTRWPHWKIGDAISEAVSKINTSINEQIEIT